MLLAAARLPGQQSNEAIARIAATYDGTDRYQLEAVNIAAAGRKSEVLALLEKKGPLSVAQFPLLELLAPERAVASLLEQLGRGNLDEKSTKTLLAAAVNVPSVEAGWGLLAIAQDTSRPTTLRRKALESVLANVSERGAWSAVADDPKFASSIEVLLADEDLRPIALRAVNRLELGALAAQVLLLAKSTALDPHIRVQAIHVAARLKPPGISEALAGLLDDRHSAVARAALDGLVDVQDIRHLREILSDDRFSADMRQRAAARLVDSTGGAIVLLRLIDEGQLPADQVRGIVARAVTHPDANVRVLYERFLPEDKRPQKLGKGVTAEQILALSGDANRGRVIFFKSSAAQCKACHAVQGFGGSTGPELSNIGKKYERRTMLETILDPSKAIAPEFVPYLLETKSGQVYAGFLAERTEDHVVLKDIKGQRVRVAADEIEVLQAQQKSLMPELVLSEVTAQDAADLLEFLTTLK